MKFSSRPKKVALTGNGLPTFLRLFSKQTHNHAPHLEGIPTELPGTITIEEWTEDDQISGTFQTFSDADHDYVLSGRFQTKL